MHTPKKKYQSLFINGIIVAVIISGFFYYGTVGKIKNKNNLWAATLERSLYFPYAAGAEASFNIKYLYVQKPIISVLKDKDFLTSRYLKIPVTDVTNEPALDFLFNTNIGIELKKPSIFFSQEIWGRMVNYEDKIKEEERQKKLAEATGRQGHYIGIEEEDTYLQIYGQQDLGVGYGGSFYLTKNKSLGQSYASSSAVKQGLDLDQNINIHIAGKIGKKVKVNVDNSGKTLDKISVEYQADKKKAFIQRIQAGNISVSIPGSSLASGSSGGGADAIGLKVDAEKNKFNFQFIASMTRGVPVTKIYKGSTEPVIREMNDYSYLHYKYYLIPNYKLGTLKVFLDNKSGLYPPTVIDANNCYQLNAGTDYVELSDGLIRVNATINDQEDVLFTFAPLGTNHIHPAFPALSSFISANIFSYKYKNTYIVTNTAVGATNSYLYLSAHNNLSPYELRNIYQLPDRYINKSKDFKIYISSTATKEQLPKSEFGGLAEDKSDTSFWRFVAPSYYMLDEINGVLIFRDNDPFDPLYYNRSLDVNTAYNLCYTPVVTTTVLQQSLFTIHLEYRYEVRSYQLGWDVIENSENIQIDGQVQRKNIDYDIDYMTGEVKFRKSVNPESEVVINYQYSPYGGSSQQYLLGLRTDFKPNDWFTASAVTFYNGRQRPIRIPSITSVADERIVGSVGGTANFTGEKITKALTNINIKLSKTLPVDITFSGEVAGSIYRPNNFGQAMLEDFEGTKNSYSLSMDYKKFLLYTPSPSIPFGSTLVRSNRGLIFFKNYWYADERKHYWLDPEKDTMPAASGSDPDPQYRTNVPYSVKPGPYMIGDGHLQDYQLGIGDRQECMVFDYDFRGKPAGDGWISLIYGQAFNKSGADFSSYSEIDMWVKLRGTASDQVELKLDIGTFSEDLDGSGAPLTEREEANVKSDGFLFYDPAVSNTQIGGGSHAYMDDKSPKTKSYDDDYRQTEDLDGNGVVDRVNSTNLEFPSGYGTVSGYNATALPNKLYIKGGDGWQKIRISIDKTKMSDSEQEILKKSIKNFVMVIKKVSGDKGKLLIDGIEFVGSTYDDFRVNAPGNSTNVSKHLNVKFVNTFDTVADGYYANSLRKFTQSDDFAKDPDFKNEKTYDELHGGITEAEADRTEETALEIVYANMSNHNFAKPVSQQTNTMVLVGRNMTSSIDLRFYKAIKMWVKPVNKIGGEWFYYRFGSSSADFYEYRIKVADLKKKWNIVNVDMSSSEFTGSTNAMYTGEENHVRLEGKPSLRNIKYIAYGVYAGGVTPGTNSGKIWINDNFVDKVTLQYGLAYYYNTSWVLRNHLSAQYSYSHSDKYFSSVGAAGSGIDTESKNISLGWTSLSFLPISGSWSRNVSQADLDDNSISYDQKGKSGGDTKLINASLNLGSIKGFGGKYSANIPGFSGNYRIAVSSNEKPLSYEKKYYLSSKSTSWGYGVNFTWVPPFADRIGLNLNTGGGMSYSTGSQLTYTYHGTNSGVKTNFIQNPITESIGYNYHVGIGYKSLSLSPAYTYQRSLDQQKMYIFFDDDPVHRPFENSTTYAKRINSRSRSISTPLSFGKIFFFTPSFNYSLNYTEGGFAYSTTNATIVRNPGVSLSMTANFGTISLFKTILTSITPNYSRSFSVNDQKIKDTGDDGWGFLRESLATFPDILIPNPFQFMDLNLIKTNYEKPIYNNISLLSRFTNQAHSESSLTLSDSLSLSLGLDIFKIITGSLSYSYSQSSGRTKKFINQYLYNHSISYGSSLNLMDKLRGFLIWKDKEGKYKKSSAVSYSISYRYSKDYLTSMRLYGITPSASLNYKWAQESDLGLTSSYAIGVNNIFKPDANFQRYIFEHLPAFYDTLNRVNQGTYARYDYALSVQLTYRFPSNLPEKWKPPFFKKTITLDSRINHTATLSFNNHLYRYNKAKDLSPEPDDLIMRLSYQHSVNYNFTKNIDGDIWAKIAYDQNLIKNKIGTTAKNVIEDVGSYELGLRVRIRF